MEKSRVIHKITNSDLWGYAPLYPMLVDAMFDIPGHIYTPIVLVYCLVWVILAFCIFPKYERAYNMWMQRPPEYSIEQLNAFNLLYIYTRILTKDDLKKCYTVEKMIIFHFKGNQFQYLIDRV